jgi:choline dehydrogenase
MTRNHFSLKGLLAIAAVFLAAAVSSAPTHKPAGNAEYVIVGGGPAGFVLAESLSRNPHINVTLLEAGPDGDSDPVINGSSQMLNEMPRILLTEPSTRLFYRAPTLLVAI